MTKLISQGKIKFYRFRTELSQESYTDFFDYYFTRLTQFAVTFLKSELLAEEIVLDVFLKLWQRKELLHKIENIETYLFISIRNTALNTLKREKKFHFDMLEDLVVNLEDYKSSVENDLIANEMLDEFNAAVHLLPSKCKIIFKLAREAGLNRNEIAQTLNISVKTVDNQVSIAVDKIAERLNINLTTTKNIVVLVTLLMTRQAFDN